MKLLFDPRTLTIGDFEDFEDIAGKRWGDVFKQDSENTDALEDPKVLKAFVWIIGRKDNPQLSLDDVRNMPSMELEVEIPTDISGQEDPTPAADETSATAPA